MGFVFQQQQQKQRRHQRIFFTQMRIAISFIWILLFVLVPFSSLCDRRREIERSVRVRGPARRETTMECQWHMN